jgi:hypothetical protein
MKEKRLRTTLANRPSQSPYLKNDRDARKKESLSLLSLRDEIEKKDESNGKAKRKDKEKLTERDIKEVTTINLKRMKRICLLLPRKNA